MKRTGKLTCVFLAAFAVLEFLLLWRISWQDAHARWDVRDARLAIRRITNNRLSALNGGVEDAIFSLKELTTWYTNWNWRRADLLLNSTVEEQRGVAIRETIQLLRRKTSQDFGDRPHDWIVAFESGKLVTNGATQVRAASDSEIKQP
jgi:hypothetical protein